MADRTISRFSFLSAASIFSLAACSGGTGTGPALLSLDSNAVLYQQMRNFGVASFRQNGQAVVLPEYAAHDFYPKPKATECLQPNAGSKSSEACSTTGGGTGTGMLTIAVVSVGTGSVTIGALDYSFTNVTGTDLQATFNGPGTPIVGPIYATTPPLPKNCIGETWAVASATITAMAQFIAANASKFASVAEWAGWALAGEITLAEFISVVLATLLAPDLLALLAAVGAAAGIISTLYLYAKCESGN